MGDSYSAAVDIALKQVVAFAEEEYDSDLDAADFEATEYINQKFPTEGSLGGLDRFLADTNREIQHLDDAMSEVCISLFQPLPCNTAERFFIPFPFPSLPSACEPRAAYTGMLTKSCEKPRTLSPRCLG